MAAVPEKQQSLRHLLDGLVVSHKQDIHDYSRGHLNEANLYQPPEFRHQKTWASSKKMRTNLVPVSKIPKSSKKGQKNEWMQSTLASFSIGTAASPAPPKLSAKKFTQFSQEPVKLNPNERKSSTESQGSYSKADDGVLVEELRAETMLNTPRSVGLKQKEWTKDRSDLRGETPRCFSQALIKDQNLAEKLKHQFVPSHLDAVTKKDQFHRMKQFEDEVVRKHDSTETNVLSGMQAVAHLERKLHRDLDTLSYNGYGPNFHRLQVYSNTFEDLIRESPTFQFILGTIKKEYDQYVSHLLDSQSARHSVLYEQVEALHTRGTSNPRLLQEEIENVTTMEAHAKELLAENERLRAELKEERDVAAKPAPEPPTQSHVFRDEPPLDLTVQVEEMRASILEKVDAMSELRNKLRKEYVPSTVCTQLEQCVKETEVEIQKLTHQKEYFDHSTSQMEAELKEAIETADTTERDARRVWKKVNAVKAIGSRPGLRLDDLDDSDHDDENKWNWYIS